MTKKEYKILSKIISNRVSDKDTEQFSKEINSLISDGLIYISLKTVHKLTAASLRVTRNGVVEYEAYNEKRQEKRTGAVRYWITTAISIAALTISIIALLK